MEALMHSRRERSSPVPPAAGASGTHPKAAEPASRGSAPPGEADRPDGLPEVEELGDLARLEAIAFSHPEARRRETAVRELARLAASGGIDALVRLVKFHPDPVLRQSASKALVRIAVTRTRRWERRWVQSADRPAARREQS